MAAGQPSTTDLPTRAKADESTPVATFGGHMKQDFLFDPEWKNMNHGSFGTYPKVIEDKLRMYQRRSEFRPDPFIRYEYPKLLDESRAEVAKIINAPVDDVVFVSNATVGVNTVLRNLVWNDDGKDVIVNFSTVYEACGKAADFLVDFFNSKVTTREIHITYPLEDDDIIARFRHTVQQIEAEGKRARVCIFDVVSSRPGVVFPWQAMVRACRDLGVLSMVDGAQAVGMLRLDLSAADPDFFVSNCHKWLYVPRGCAVFYVPRRNQHLVATTLATSHGYVPKSVSRISPLPPSAKSDFVKNFQFVGTIDNSPYLCVKDAIAWRREVLGGEDRVIDHLWTLNKKGSDIVASVLGTEVMENAKGTLRNCAMANVALPIWVETKGPKGKDTDAVLTSAESSVAFQWFLETMVNDYKTFMALFVHEGRYWIRISAQIYLDLEDYTSSAEVLKALCERVAKKEFKDA
ncbi:hypothetical protein ACO1O0_005903 [Amphichorda felina]